MFSNIFNSNKKTTVVVKLDTNVTLTLTPVVGGGVDATLTETRGVFERKEKAYFLELKDLMKSLRLTDADIIRKLEKAF